MMYEQVLTSIILLITKRHRIGVSCLDHSNVVRAFTSRNKVVVYVLHIHIFIYVSVVYEYFITGIVFQYKRDNIKLL